MKKKNELTTKQRDLVDTIVTTGCTITDASQKVGYAKGEAGRVVASRTLRLPHVRAPERIQHDIQGDIKINIDLS